jgi:hypothetical protein
MVLNLFTLFHVLISLVAILAGFVVVFGMIGGRPLAGWTALFLTTTVATSVTGFLFPFHHFMPSHAVGILSLVVLGVAIYARYSRQLAGGWRRTYALTAVIALYFNFFVLVAQLFQKVPALNVLAPKGTEPPFAITQGVVMIIFVGLGIAAARKFRNPVPL